MLRATLKQTQRGIIKRALITDIPIKNWDCPRLVLEELKSPVCVSVPFGSSSFSMPLARFYSIKSSGDGNETKGSSSSAFAAPNLGGGIIGGNAPTVANATATAAQSRVMGSSSSENSKSSSSFGNNEEADDVFKKGIATDEAKELLKKKGMATSEMSAGQTLSRPGKLGSAEPIECINSTVPTQAKAGDKNETKAKSENAPANAPSPINEAINMANKQLQEIIANSPDKKQMEKYFFRVVAFIYDLSYLLGTATIRFIEKNIIQNKTVQHYWKRLHEKMEQAKKD